ncbi:Proton-dependent Oligopeptide Transporter (POT) Family [Thraustotheca clavata]|uniref:Proton-dependent Oligopeptide Transporter (POT) Family n=1 Tax=Thraustotheca clavata TaxID=74557 RepID=A0A1W0A707_9STRA|nr:Proton-dependent Oligopeptide Transporter (POT) Family [Thraustotheca clavata]
MKEEALSTPNAGVYTSVWDARPVKYKSVLFQVCGYILMMELAERLSYYGINQGLRNFMKTILGWSGVSANSIKSTWTSLCYMSPLLGAYLADERWGRFKTIAVFGTLYLIGDTLLAVAANPHVLNWKETNVTGEFERKGADTKTAEGIFVFGLFACIGIGTGAIKSNVITLGADQFNPNDPKEEAQKVTFFSYFYWCINFGAGFAYGYLATLCVKGSSSISADYGYFATFLICACVMGVALLMLIAGQSRYVKFPPNSDAMSKLVRIMSRGSKFSTTAQMCSVGFILYLLSFFINMIAVFLKDGSSERLALSYIAGIIAIAGCGCWVYYGMNFKDMEKASSANGGTLDNESVEEIKLVVRVLPFAAFLVMWQCIYDQIDANFQVIAQQTDLRFGDNRHSTQLPGAVLGVFDPIAIVILIPLLDSVIYPAYKRWTGKDASPFGKVFVGLAIASFTMFYVGVFEILRKDSGLIKVEASATNSTLDVIKDEGGEQPMCQMRWGFNVLHYILVALCECLINVTAFDVFYSEVPIYLKSTCQAINLFMVSMGSNVTSIFTLLFQKHIPDNLNEGHLEYMFFTVGCVAIVNLVLYTIVMRKMQFGMHNSSQVTSDELADEKNATIDRTSNQMDARQSFTQQRA